MTFRESLRNACQSPALGYALLRIYLGIALFIRGVLFLSNPGDVLTFIHTSGDWFVPILVAHYVGLAHLCGGILLAFGAATRAASIAQLPILFGAVFFVHWGEGLLGASQSLELAGLVLAMLLVYSVFGAGPVSVDQRLAEARARREGRSLLDGQALAPAGA